MPTLKVSSFSSISLRYSDRPPPSPTSLPPPFHRPEHFFGGGEEMRLRPTIFSAAGSEDDEHEVPAYRPFGMTADSHASLSSTRLDWHYRSRHEALIGFCNQAFYFGRLKTI